jgi:hypothetical protein
MFEGHTEFCIASNGASKLLGVATLAAICLVGSMQKVVCRFALELGKRVIAGVDLVNVWECRKGEMIVSGEFAKK